MSTTKKHLIEVRSNTNFNLNYETNNLVPQVELILLMQEPVYSQKLNKQKTHYTITKDHELGEFRCFTTMAGINALIGKLQEVAAGLQRFEQMSTGLNSIIEQAKRTQEREKPTP